MSGAEPGAFDATGYRQRVLATLRKSASLDLSDPFFIVDLPVEVDDEDLIRARITALVGFWNKERSPNYRALAADLARHRADLEAVLLNPARRTAAAAKARQARAAADADRYSSLDSLVARLTERFGGVPRSRLPGLARLAKGRGIDDDAFAAWVAGQRVIDDGADAEPLPPGVREQIRSDLSEFGRLTGDPGRSATLWTFMGLPPDAADADLAARHAELTRQNELRQHDRQMTVVANLLTYARQRLIDGDRDRYAASLVEDAKDLLRDTIAERVIVDGELSAADYEACVAKAMGLGFGLTTAQARGAVRQVATDLGATLAVAPAADYVVCPNCREPQPAGAEGSCRYCGADLFARCPSCGQRVPQAAASCQHCGANLRLLRDCTERLDLARADLAAGRPAAARDRLAGAERAARDAPDLAGRIEAATAEIDRVIAAAQADWLTAERDLAGHRLFAAMDRLARIARVAADVPGPAGEPADHMLDELAGRKADVQARLAAARRLPEGQREAALTSILAQAADCQEAADLLASLPLPAPARLSAELLPDAVLLRWDPVPVPQAVYKIVRLATPPGGGPPETRALGTTQQPEFEDAGVPGGTVVAHEVIATAGRRTSPPARTVPALLARDIAGLRARVEPGAITLTWSLPIDSRTGRVVVERTAAPDSPVKTLPRRAIAEGSSWTDPNPPPGVEFTYHVFAEYRDPKGNPTRTPGAIVKATAAPPLRPAPPA